MAWVVAPCLVLLLPLVAGDVEEEKYGVKYASTCEVCKVIHISSPLHITSLLFTLLQGASKKCD